MKVQSQERLPYSALLLEYVPLQIAQGIVLPPGTPSFEEHSIFLPNGWEESSSSYILAMLDLDSLGPSGVLDEAEINFMVTINDKSDAFEHSFELSGVLRPAEYALESGYRKNIPLVVGMLDLTGFSILSRITICAERSDSWPGVITINSLILMVPQQSLGSRYPDRRD